MQLEFADGGADDDDFSTVELTITPPDSDATPSQASQLYEAIANCSNLHPDPNNDEEDDEDEYDRIVFEGSAEHEALDGFTGVLRGNAQGGLPPPMPGSGGWITADNVHEYFDEDGNWIGGNQEEGEELGEGAGRTRGRDELEGDTVNGHAENGDSESKRPRVD
jgi:nucleotide-sensitive chloride channel 1A